MTAPPTRTLTLVIERGADPITGSVIDEDGDHRPFEGWLGLTQALMRHLDRAAAHESTPTLEVARSMSGP